MNKISEKIQDQLLIGRIKQYFICQQQAKSLPYFSYHLVFKKTANKNEQTTFRICKNTSSVCNAIQYTIIIGYANKSAYTGKQTKSNLGFEQDRIFESNCSQEFNKIVNLSKLDKTRKFSTFQQRNASGELKRYPGRTQEEDKFLQLIKRPSIIFFILFATSVTFNLDKRYKLQLKIILDQLQIPVHWKKGSNYYKALLQPQFQFCNEIDQYFKRPMICYQDLLHIQQVQRTFNTFLKHQSLNDVISKIKHNKRKNSFEYCKNYFDNDLLGGLFRVPQQFIDKQYERILKLIQQLYNSLSSQRRLSYIQQQQNSVVMNLNKTYRNRENISMNVRRTYSILQTCNQQLRQPNKYSLKQLKVYIRSVLVSKSRLGKSQCTEIVQNSTHSERQQRQYAYDMIKQAFQQELFDLRRQKQKNNNQDKQSVQFINQNKIDCKKFVIEQEYKQVATKISKYMQIDYKSMCLVQIVINNLINNPEVYHQHRKQQVINSPVIHCHNVKSKQEGNKSKQSQDKSSVQLILSERFIESDSQNRLKQSQLQSSLVRKQFNLTLNNSNISNDNKELLCGLYKHIQYLENLLAQNSIQYTKLIFTSNASYKRQVSQLNQSSCVKQSKQQFDSVCDSLINKIPNSQCINDNQTKRNSLQLKPSLKKDKNDQYLQNKIRQLKRQSFIKKPLVQQQSLKTQSKQNRKIQRQQKKNIIEGNNKKLILSSVNTNKTNMSNLDNSKSSTPSNKKNSYMSASLTNNCSYDIKNQAKSSGRNKAIQNSKNSGNKTNQNSKKSLWNN